jgi:hypothetical protein
MKTSDRSRLVRGGLRSHGATHDAGGMYLHPQIHELELRDNLGRADQATRGCQAGEGLCFAAGPHRPPFSRLRTTFLWTGPKASCRQHCTIRGSGVSVNLATNEILTARSNPGPRLSAHSRRNWNQLPGPSQLLSLFISSTSISA